MADETAVIYFIFPSVTQVLNAEDFWEEHEVPFELVSVPKEVNPNCGLALSFATSEKERVLGLLKEAGLDTPAAYLKTGESFSPLPL